MFATAPFALAPAAAVATDTVDPRRTVVRNRRRRHGKAHWPVSSRRHPAPKAAPRPRKG